MWIATVNRSGWDWERIETIKEGTREECIKAAKTWISETLPHPELIIVDTIRNPPHYREVIRWYEDHYPDLPYIFAAVKEVVV